MITVKSQRLQQHTYDLHGLVRIQVCSPHAAVIHSFDAELGRFRCSDAQAPDIQVVVDQFHVDPGPARVTEQNYVLDTTIYGDDRHKVARWRFAIQGLNDQMTRLYFSGGPFSLGFLHHRYVEQLMRYKLAQRGYTLVHGCCLVRGGRAVLLPGLMHTGKTSIALHLVRRGWQFQSDDYTIVGGERTHCYPRRLHFSSHVKERYPEALETLKPRHHIEMTIKQAIHRLTFGYGSLSQALSIEELVPDVVIADTARLDQVLLLSTHTGSRLEGPIPVTTTDALDRMVAINCWEGNRFWRLLLEAASMNVPVPLTQWLDQRQMLAASLQGVVCHEILIPRQVGDFKALLMQIGDIVEQISGQGTTTRDPAGAESEPYAVERRIAPL
jgi:hypothetical protein